MKINDGGKEPRATVFRHGHDGVVLNQRRVPAVNDDVGHLPADGSVVIENKNVSQETSKDVSRQRRRTGNG